MLGNAERRVALHCPHTVAARSATPTRRRRRWSVLLGVLAALLALEGALQVGHVATWWLRPSASKARTDARRVLCVGDSFTFGIGSSAPEHSYPGRLQTALAGRADGPWTVVNEGWPGRNSREVLENIGALLQRHTAALVCILIGVNDTWSRPGRLATGAEDAGRDDRGLHFRWRTARLLALCVDALTGEGQTAPPTPSLLGSWAMIHRRIDFVADGTGSLEGLPMTWRQEGPSVEIRASDQFHVIARVRGNHRMVQLEHARAGASAITLERLESMVDLRIAAARRAILESNHASAQMLVAPALAMTRDTDAWSVRVHRAALEVAASAGDDAAQQVHASWLSARGENLAMPGDAASAVEVDGTLEVVLAEHLRRTVAMCRRSGAEPILVTYPYEWEFLAVHARIAEELGVEVVQAGPVFADLARAEPATQFFIADGHCNDRGYAHLAELVAAAVTRVLDRLASSGADGAQATHVVR